MPTKKEIRRWKTVHIPQAMKALKEAYEAVFYDRYRETCGTGKLGFRQYLENFEKMVSALSNAIYMVQLQRYHDNGMDADNMGPVHFYHELYHFIETVRTDGDVRKDGYVPMVVLERYLVQVHRFLDTKDFDRFSVFSEDCFEKWHWWGWDYSPEDKAYIIADEYLEEYVEAYDYRSKIERFGVSELKDRLSRNERSIVRRMKKADKWSRDCKYRCYDASRAAYRGGKKGNPLCSYGGAVVKRCTRKKCPKNNL